MEPGGWKRVSSALAMRREWKIRVDKGGEPCLRVYNALLAGLHVPSYSSVSFRYSLALAKPFRGASARRACSARRCSFSSFL